MTYRQLTFRVCSIDKSEETTSPSKLTSGSSSPCGHTQASFPDPPGAQLSPSLHYSWRPAAHQLSRTPGKTTEETPYLLQLGLASYQEGAIIAGKQCRINNVHRLQDDYQRKRRGDSRAKEDAGHGGTSQGLYLEGSDATDHQQLSTSLRPAGLPPHSPSVADLVPMTWGDATRRRQLRHALWSKNVQVYSAQLCHWDSKQPDITIFTSPSGKISMGWEAASTAAPALWSRQLWGKLPAC